VITYVDFSLFQSPAKVLVNTVNTVGVMGKGIAKDFRRIYPEMFAEYQRLCESDRFGIGDLWPYKTPHKWILNFPTKKHWRQPSKPEYIDAGLQKFAQMYQEAKITSISFPMLGCGNGELDWKSQVRPLMEKHLKQIPIQIFIHLVQQKAWFVPERLDQAAISRWLRGEPQSLPFVEVWEDLVAAIGDRKCFDSLDGRSFSAVIFNDDGGGLRLEVDSEIVMIHKDQLADLWAQIRDIGLCIPQIMPGGLDQFYKLLLPVLSVLPYLKSIRQADRHTGLTRNATGLLFQPDNHVQVPPAPKQLELV
jgi:O-acetyl-ADP-ribose deacetylase (regulator of RNase III)